MRSDVGSIGKRFLSENSLSEQRRPTLLGDQPSNRSHREHSLTSSQVHRIFLARRVLPSIVDGKKLQSTEVLPTSPRLGTEEEMWLENWKGKAVEVIEEVHAASFIGESSTSRWTSRSAHVKHVCPVPNLRDGQGRSFWRRHRCTME